MSSLKERLSEAMKTAMKSGDKATLGFARNLHSAVRKKEIDDRVDLDDAGLMKIASSLIKQRQDSIDQFRQGGRADLVAQEEAELKFLQGFLPAQMPESEVRQIVAQSVAEARAGGPALGPKDMGKVMKILMPKLQGRADGKLISQLVKESLETSS